MNQSEKAFKRFLLLWSGDFISAIGSGLTSFGLGVYLFQQTGKVSLMALVTLLADYLFTPLLLPDGALSESVGKWIGTGPGRGIGLLIVLAGLLLCGAGVVLLGMKSIQKLERGGAYDK